LQQRGRLEYQFHLKGQQECFFGLGRGHLPSGMLPVGQHSSLILPYNTPSAPFVTH
jgi:hypothetical protein